MARRRSECAGPLGTKKKRGRSGSEWPSVVQDDTLAEGEIFVDYLP